jgi:hypothetical protein
LTEEVDIEWNHLSIGRALHVIGRHLRGIGEPDIPPITAIVIAKKTLISGYGLADYAPDYKQATDITEKRQVAHRYAELVFDYPDWDRILELTKPDKKK